MIAETPRYGFPDLGYQFALLAGSVGGQSGYDVVTAEIDGVRRPDGTLVPADISGRYKKIKDGPLYLFGSWQGMRAIAVEAWSESGFGMFQKRAARAQVGQIYREHDIEAAVDWAMANQTKNCLSVDVLRSMLSSPYSESLDRDFFAGELARTFRKWRR